MFLDPSDRNELHLHHTTLLSKVLGLGDRFFLYEDPFNWALRCLIQSSSRLLGVGAALVRKKGLQLPITHLQFRPITIFQSDNPPHDNMDEGSLLEFWPRFDVFLLSACKNRKSTVS